MEDQPLVQDSSALDAPLPDWRPSLVDAPPARRTTAAYTLSAYDGLFVRQQREWGEILTGWETKNRYNIFDRNGQLLFHAGELAESKAAVFFLKNQRPFTIELREPDGALFMTVTRPWRWFFPRAEVYSAHGRLLGAVQRRWGWFRRKYSIEDAKGREIAVVRSSYFRRWRFRVLVDGHEAGLIAKKWSGSLQEFFSAADSFSVTFTPELAPELRPTCLGATFLIDFVHFEN